MHFNVRDEITYPYQKTTTAVPLMFGNGEEISTHTLLGMCLRIDTEIQVNLC